MTLKRKKNQAPLHFIFTRNVSNHNFCSHCIRTIFLCAVFAILNVKYISKRKTIRFNCISVHTYKSYKPKFLIDKILCFNFTVFSSLQFLFCTCLLSMLLCFCSPLSSLKCSHLQIDVTTRISNDRRRKKTDDKRKCKWTTSARHIISHSFETFTC